MEDHRPVKLTAATLVPVGALIVFAIVIAAFTTLQNRVSEHERRIVLMEETQIAAASDAKKVDDRLARIETTLNIILEQLKKQ